ncbi:LacI family transcriptional regulator [Paenibacillus doosanensis]|uniref:Catabolite control protein A n=1 Tax=Paenibacillus konkukensis TaxID=2020716 RepID=A0ABY4RLH2_9BACL|nr:MULTISPECIES: LacI family DNA-binding transcriptional regulator [Paenibacillus]MCS7462251.1 LacI family transcriptional regulator [Paenibacillus doosanensis]UQZ82880.1 Catabolite control protein A [Paenibacillus konkukensis]
MASIKDVAKMAGVSVATVSRVLNDKGYVGQHSREKVEKAIKELNYKPNEIARSLFKKHSNTIGLIVPDIMNPYFPELARAVEDTASKLGYNVILCNSDENKEKEQAYLDVLKQNYVNGIIVSSNTLTAEQIEALNIPIVSIDREISKGLPTIVVENKKGAKAATHFLKSKGRKRIGHIRGTAGVVNAEERCGGYREAVAEEPWFTESYIVNGNYDMESSIDATRELLGRHPDIDGIFAANDMMAIGAIKAAYQLGKKVPEELAVIGFDGIVLSSVMIPELTTVAQPIYEMGELATTVLVNLMEQQPMEKTYYTLEVELIERRTT